jgi:hypothetical protein
MIYPNPIFKIMFFFLRTNLCTGCLKEESAHTEIGSLPKWNYKSCTVLEPTDAYGVLTFPGSHTKNANVSYRLGFLVVC